MCRAEKHLVFRASSLDIKIPDRVGSSLILPCAARGGNTARGASEHEDAAHERDGGAEPGEDDGDDPRAVGGNAR